MVIFVCLMVMVSNRTQPIRIDAGLPSAQHLVYVANINYIIIIISLTTLLCPSPEWSDKHKSKDIVPHGRLH